MIPGKGEITALLYRSRAGDQNAENELLELLYEQLHRMASARIKAERGALTLSATALIHEAYLRMAPRFGFEYHDRNHFLAVAATVMRRILVDRARAHGAAKRSASRDEVRINNIELPDPASDDFLIALDTALVQLARLCPRQSRVVELRYFAGLNEGEIASLLGVTRRTINRDWQMARAWLHSQVFS